VSRPATWRWRRLALLAVAVPAGCTHDGPFVPGAYAPGVPPGAGALVQLTYNGGADLAPSWLPDGSGFFYTAERLDRPDRDRCLALLPAAGGTIAREICNRVPAADDSVDALSAAAVAPDGRLAYVRASAPLDVGRPLAPRFYELVVATLTDPHRVTVLRAFPHLGPSGRGHDGAAQLRWLADSVLVYVGQRVAYVPPCSRCPPDTVPSGLELVRLDFGGPVPVLSMLPGSDQASSVAVAGRDTVLFTVNGDSRVFRLDLSTDSLAVVHDFGAGGIARDVQVAGNKLLAVVGGNVSFTNDPSVGSLQRDGGGTIFAVDLPTGTETPVTPVGFLFRHIALAPSGTRLVAELVLGATADLWLVEVP
jgi:hypothetical protein